MTEEDKKALWEAIKGISRENDYNGIDFVNLDDLEDLLIEKGLIIDYLCKEREI